MQHPQEPSDSNSENVRLQDDPMEMFEATVVCQTSSRIEPPKDIHTIKGGLLTSDTVVRRETSDGVFQNHKPHQQQDIKQGICLQSSKENSSSATEPYKTHCRVGDEELQRSKEAHPKSTLEPCVPVRTVAEESSRRIESESQVVVEQVLSSMNSIHEQIQEKFTEGLQSV